MSELPLDFYFTQMRLQDYLDCKRRFQLRYLLKQPWPAHVIEPVDQFEEHIEQGQQFHRLIHRYLLGMPAETLHRMAETPPLSIWWQDLLAYGFEDMPATKFPEVPLNTSLEGFRLLGKFDLVAVDDSGAVLIVDWKTSNYIPELSELRKRMQSKMYPFIISQEGLSKYGFESVHPDQISMRYWFAEEPDSYKEFSYSQMQYERDADDLSRLIHEIRGTDTELFELTDDSRKCRFCIYRSLCDRGDRAGTIDEYARDMDMIAEWPSSIDLDEIPEIEF